MRYYYSTLVWLFVAIFVGCVPSETPVSKSNPVSTPNPISIQTPLNEGQRNLEEKDELLARRQKSEILSAEAHNEARKELIKQQKIYDEIINPNKHNDYSGFHNRYIIFEKENSLLARLTPDEVLFYAELADLIYVKKFKSIEEIEIGLLEKLQIDKYREYEIAGTIRRGNNTELSALMLYSKEKNHFLVVFRGSVSLMDWAQNLNFTSYKYGSDQREKSLMTLEGFKPNVHRGFAETYLQGREQFDELFGKVIARYYDSIVGNSAPFRITTLGHSLGGALALLKANDFPRILLETGLFTSDSNFIIETISFGAPRVYDAVSSRKVEENLRGPHNIVRFVHKDDPVPNLPTHHLGGADIGTPIYISSSVGLSAFKNPGRHMMGSYLKSVRAVYEKLKTDSVFARQTKGAIVSLKKALSDTSKNSFDAEDARLKLEYKIDENKFKQSFYKTLLDLSLGQNEEVSKNYEKAQQRINELEILLKSVQ